MECQLQFLLAKTYTLITIVTKRRQRLVNVKKETYRFLQGFRGTEMEIGIGKTAFVTSKARHLMM